MITIELPLWRMDFKEFLAITTGLVMAGHEKAAQVLVEKYVKEAIE